MRMRKIAVAVVTIGLGGGLIAASPAATAAESGPSVASVRAAEKFTLYEHDDQGGRHIGFTRDDKNLDNNRWDGANGNVNDKASSHRNHRNKKVRIWTKAGFNGEVYTAAPNSEDDDLSNNPIGDNSVSSVDINGNS
ncbi:peptidase inhibitor family I36 protein [Streptomyces sp. T-3]|nr:peptidase inhibitor family I36 protein [Streptomyces sp. T-3]